MQGLHTYKAGGVQEGEEPKQIKTRGALNLKGWTHLKLQRFLPFSKQLSFLKIN